LSCKTNVTKWPNGQFSEEDHIEWKKYSEKLPVNRRLLAVAICLLLFLVYFLNKGFNFTSENQNGNSIAVLKDKSHEVQTRRSKSLSWDDTKLGEPFQYYDSILTMKESQADVAFNDGTNLDIGPDSLVVLEPPLEKQSGMRLNLKQGTATLRLKKGEKIETKNKSILAKEDTVIQLSTDTKNNEDVIFVDEIPAVNEKTVTAFPHQISPIEISSLTESKVISTSIRKPAAIDIKLLRAPKIKILHQAFKVQARQSYYRVTPPKSLLQQLVLLLIPEASAQINEGVARLEWENLPEASGYEVEFSTDKDFKNIIMTKNTKYNMTVWDQANAGTFYWRVRGMDQDGHLGEFSEVASFEVLIVPNEISVLPTSQEITQTPSETPNKESANPQSPAHAVQVENEVPIISSHGPDQLISQTPVVTTEPSPKPEVSTDKKQSLFALDVRAFGTWGSMGDQEGYFPSVPMLTGSGAMAVGCHLGRFTPSIYGEYFISNQMVSPSSTSSNENASGTGYLFGGELKWKGQKFFIAGSYLFLGQYKLNQQTVAYWNTTSQTSVYNDPSAFELTLGWALTERLSFIITGKDVTYYQWNLGGNNINISGDTSSQISYGVGLNYEFF